MVHTPDDGVRIYGGPVSSQRPTSAPTIPATMRTKATKVVGGNNRSRWWVESPGGWDPSRSPSRYGFDCGGRHRNSEGRITAAKLTELYDAAVTRGVGDIFI